VAGQSEMFNSPPFERGWGYSFLLHNYPAHNLAGGGARATWLRRCQMGTDWTSTVSSENVIASLVIICL